MRSRFCRAALAILAFAVSALATICDQGYEDKLHDGVCVVCDAGTVKSSRGTDFTL